MSFVSKAAFANAVGVSQAAVSLAIKRNPNRIIIVEIDGKEKVDLEQSLIAWNATLQSNNIPRVDQPTKSKSNPKPKTQENTDELITELDDDLNLDKDLDLTAYKPLTRPEDYDEKELQKARSFLDGKKKESDLIKARIEREKMCGELLDRESVELFLSTFLTHASAGLKVLPNSVSVIIAAKIKALIDSGDFIDENTINSIVNESLAPKLSEYIAMLKKEARFKL